MAERVQTTVQINSNLLSQAEEMGIDLSEMLEQRLIEEIHQSNRDRWGAAGEAGDRKGSEPFGV